MRPLQGDGGTRRPLILRTAALLMIVAAALLQAITVINAVAVIISVRGAHMAYPDESYFIDAEASADQLGTAIGLVINLGLGVWLVLLARQVWHGRRRAGVLTAVCIIATAVLAAICISQNPVSQAWDPDGYDLVSKFVPSWHRSALTLAAVLAAGSVALAGALLLTPTARHVVEHPPQS